MNFRYIIVFFVLIASIGVSSASLTWDVNTIYLNHFNSIDTKQSYNQTYAIFPYQAYSGSSVCYPDLNRTLDETGLVGYSRGGPGVMLSSNGKFGNYSVSYTSDVIDLTHQYPYSCSPSSQWQSTPYNSDWDFGTSVNKNWTAEFWYYPIARSTFNTSIIKWNGNGTVSGVDSKVYNGTKIYIDKYGFIGVCTPGTICYSDAADTGVYTMSKLLNTTTPLSLGTWSHVAVLKNGTALQIYINGVRSSPSFTTATSYNWTAGYTFGSVTTRDIQVGSINSGGGLWNLDEVRISNTSRYGGNFTPQTAEFLNPNNKTTLISEIGSTPADKFTGISSRPLTSNEYSYNDFVPYIVSIQNASYTKSIFITLGNDGYPGQKYHSSSQSSGKDGLIIPNTTFVTNQYTLPTSSSTVGYDTMPLPSYVSGITKNPDDSMSSIDDDGFGSRTGIFVNTTTQSSLSSKTSLFDITNRAGVGFPKDRTTLLGNPLRTVPAYPTTFEYTNGGLNTLWNQKNSTPDINAIEYTQEIGGSTIGFFVNESSVNIGQNASVIVYTSDIFLTDGIYVNLTYDPLKYQYTGFSRTGLEPELEGNTTLTVVTDPINGIITLFLDPNVLSSDSTTWRDRLTVNDEISPYYPYFDFVQLNMRAINTTTTGYEYPVSYTLTEPATYSSPEFIPAYGYYVPLVSNPFTHNEIGGVDITDNTLTTTFELVDINNNQKIPGGAWLAVVGTISVYEDWSGWM